MTRRPWSCTGPRIPTYEKPEGFLIKKGTELWLFSHLGGRWTRSVLAIPISRESSGRQLQAVDDMVSSPSSENDGLREDKGGTQATLAIMVVPLTLPGKEAER